MTEDTMLLELPETTNENEAVGAIDITELSDIEDEWTPAQQQVIEYFVSVGWTQEAAEDAARAMETEPECEPAKAFTIDSRKAADWVVRHISEAEKEMAAIEEMYKAEFDRLSARKAELMKHPKAKHDFFYNRYYEELKAFAKAELEGKKERNVGLIYGKLQFAGGRESTVINDMDKTISILERIAPKAVEITKSVRVKNIPPEAYAEGEAAGAFAKVVGAESFTVKAAK